MVKLILFSFAISFFSSCCSDDKVCPDGQITNFSALPYQPGQKITFKDSIGNTIEISLKTKISTSIGQSAKGNCNAFKKDLTCDQSINLYADSINVSNNILAGYNKKFNVSLYKSDYSKNIEKFNFSGLLFNYDFYGSTYSDSISNSKQYYQLTGYRTPYKLYSNVYVAKTDKLNNGQLNLRKFVVDNKGRLVSFSLSSDSLNLFHLVE